MYSVIENRRYRLTDQKRSARPGRSIFCRNHSVLSRSSKQLEISTYLIESSFGDGQELDRSPEIDKISTVRSDLADNMRTTCGIQSLVRRKYFSIPFRFFFGP